MHNISKKEIYSPYDLSHLFKVNQETIQSWLKEKRLECFRIPGGHLRVTHQNLEIYMKENHYPEPEHWNGKMEKFKTLVVEDDGDLLETMAELLEEEPRLEVKMESNGLSAALQIASWHPDLILLDFVMPGMDGFDICKKIRGNIETRDIPVLAVTALSNFENVKAVFDTGISDFLEKPFYSEGLLAKVRGLLGISALNPA